MSQIEINGEKKEYVLTRRKGMKSIRFRLDENGVILVSAPYQVSVSFIEKVLIEHGDELIAGRKRVDEIGRAHV